MPVKTSLSEKGVGGRRLRESRCGKQGGKEDESRAHAPLSITGVNRAAAG